MSMYHRQINVDKMLTPMSIFYLFNAIFKGFYLGIEFIGIKNVNIGMDEEKMLPRVLIIGLRK
jgi:hypothetical protein